MTNLFLVTLIVTNWVDTGDWKREGGTNYVKQRMVLETNVLALEVVSCTNRTLIKSVDSGTNGPTVWRVVAPMLPALPIPGFTPNFKRE